MGPFASLYNTIDAFYTEIKLIISHIDYSTSLRSKVNSIVNWQYVEEVDKRLINDYYKLDAIPFRPLYNSLYVSVVAGFEGLLRDFLFVVIQQKQAKGALDEVFLKKHIQLSGVILSQSYTIPQYLNIDIFKVARNLGTCFPKNTNYSLNPEIAYFMKNIFDIVKIFEFLSDCKIAIDLDTVSRNQNLETLLGTNGVRDTGKEILRKIDQFTEARNRIAHTGLVSSEITSSTILDLISFLLLVSKIVFEETATKF